MFVYTTHDVVLAFVLLLSVVGVTGLGLTFAVLRLTSKLMGLVRRLRPWAGR